MTDPPSLDDREDVTAEMELVDETGPRELGALRIVKGSEVGVVLSIPPVRSVVVGRGTDADVRLPDESLSRRHARFFHLGGAHYVEDLGSTNGVRVEGAKIGGLPRRLSHGDRVQLGKETVFLFELHDPASKRAAEELYRQAVRDGLTGLYNRRYLDERLEQESAYSARHEQPLSVILIDLDHFKQVNDEHGHAAGDTVLRSVSRVIEGAVRSEDIVARYGGEELCVLARGTAARGALALAERLRRNVESLPIRCDAVTLRVTASFGVATAHASDGLLEAADAALYAAKEAGRNRCVHARDVEG
ncbi:MAG: GGDEF domain-containing protein [Deltaproteobacteria bacterium]|nr:GGDEF domain-containing protein [Deltaproteobacteria bacterium]